MRLNIQKIKVAVLAVAVVLTIIMPAVTVHAATGKTTIAVSAGEIKVGENVSVTIKAKTDGGNTAKAKLKLTYDKDILEFVSCSATYDGGAGGSVTATASSMTVKFKAVSEGGCPLIVDASNGVASESGSSLSSVEGCSTNITVKAASGNTGSSGNLSADNSLKTLILSDGTLSPTFAGNVVNYTATVAEDVTEVEVEVETSNRNATIESISGNTDLQVGLNTIKIVVKAENGALATYTIDLIREEQTITENTNTENTNTEVVEDTVNKELEAELKASVEQNELLSHTYKQLEETYQREKEFSRAVIYALIFVIAILIVIIINLIALYRREADVEFEDSFERKKKTEKPVAKIAERKTEEAKKEEPKKDTIIKVEKPTVKKEKMVVNEVQTSTKIEKTSAKTEVRNNFEVLDFNDED